MEWSCSVADNSSDNNKKTFQSFAVLNFTREPNQKNKLKNTVRSGFGFLFVINSHRPQEWFQKFNSASLKNQKERNRKKYFKKICLKFRILKHLKSVPPKKRTENKTSGINILSELAAAAKQLKN